MNKKTTIYHNHHIIPKYAGGTDDPSNIIRLTVKKHFDAHYRRWKKYGDIRDLQACALLDKQKEMTGEELYLIYSSAGKLGGKSQFINKKGFHSLSSEEQKKNSSKGGKNGYFSKKFAKRNGISEKERIKKQKERGKKGGPKNKGFIWINDGIFSRKYTIKEQKKESIETFLKKNKNYSIGRLNVQEDVSCPHCNKKGKKSGMVLHHFDKCSVLTGKKRSFKIKKIICPHCKKEGAGGAMKRYHFENCKFKGKNKNENKKH